MSTRLSTDGAGDGGSRFTATRWSVVLAAGNWRADGNARAAMGEFARIYWFALYAFARKLGANPTQSEDLVQGFLLNLMEKDALSAAKPEKGKFRSFLMVSFRNYMFNDWNKSAAAKRGGGQKTVAIDTLDAENRYGNEPVDTMTPEKMFDRKWALAVLDEVLVRLRKEYEAKGKGDVFKALEHVLVHGDTTSYAQIAQDLGMTESAVKVTAHRIKARYRELLREEIAQTVSDPGMVDDEVKELLESL